MDQSASPYDAERGLERPAYIQSGSISAVKPPEAPVRARPGDIGTRERAQAIVDTAIATGVKAGLAAQMKQITAAVNAVSRELDTAYDFGPLMIRDRVVPPVITEARDMYNQQGDYALRLSGAVYRIEYQARFASKPPNWREYLSFAVPEPDRSDLLGQLVPRDATEKMLWQASVNDGWQQGVIQANVQLQYGLDRLNRDYLGMMRFHTFVRQGKVTMPVIAADDIPVSRAGGMMAIDETLLRITTLPDFDSRMDRWRSTVITSPVATETAK